MFFNTEANFDFNYHTAPVPHYAIILEGEFGFSVSSGEERVFKAGDVLLVDDVTGKGHRTRSVGGVVGKWAWVPLKAVPTTGLPKPELSGHKV